MIQDKGIVFLTDTQTDIQLISKQFKLVLKLIPSRSVQIDIVKLVREDTGLIS